MTLKLNGATSGSVSLDAPATGSNVSLELPTDSIKPGLVLVAAQSFTGVSSVSVNNCFTATYENYRVLVNGVSSVATAASNPMRWRYRSGGTDKTSSIYYNQGLYSTNSAGPSRYYNATESSATVGWMGDEAFGNALDVFQPFGTTRKKQIVGYAHAAGTSSAISAQFSGWMNEAYSADGFTIFQDSGTFTGTVRVYGYRNSL